MVFRSFAIILALIGQVVSGQDVLANAAEKTAPNILFIFRMTSRIRRSAVTAIRASCWRRRIWTVLRARACGSIAAWSVIQYAGPVEPQF